MTPDKRTQKQVRNMLLNPWVTVPIGAISGGLITGYGKDRLFDPTGALIGASYGGLMSAVNHLNGRLNRVLDSHNLLNNKES